MKSFLGTISTIVVVLAIVSETTAEFKCPSDSGFFRNPQDPHEFFECINGIAYEYKCPSNLVFNESLNRCDYTTGPDMQHTTAGPVVVPTGHRGRHTDQTAGTEATTVPVSTRGSHDRTEQSEATTAAGEVTTTAASEATTRGRHGH